MKTYWRLSTGLYKICQARCCKNFSIAIYRSLLWPPYGIGQAIIFLPCGFFLSSSLPAALRAAQICRYLVYSESDFEVFRPAGATRCTDGGEIWHGWGDGSAKFHTHRCNDKGVGPPKLKFLLRFDQNVEYKRPVGAYPCAIFTKFAEFVPHFRIR